MHFEELWEMAEKSQKQDDPNIQNLLNELMLKIKLYQIIDSQSNFNEQEKSNMKKTTFGEILYVLTAISLKDNIDSFQTLFAKVHQS